MKIKIFILGLIAISFISCKKWFEPDPENLKSEDQMYDDSRFAQGFLNTTYRTIPGYYNNSDVATDDAVTNVRTNDYLQIATGSWTASYNPLNFWNTGYGSLLYLNLFLANSEKVHWANDPEVAKLFNMRLRGEAFGLRALYLYYLVRNHAGIASNGELLGVPLITEYQTANSEFNLPRASFKDCIQQILTDLDSAEYYLPMEYNDVSNESQIPEKFRSVTTNVGTYSRVMGTHSRQLFNALIAKSMRARTTLLAASPAFQHASNNYSWENAANAAAEIINYKGGANALPANGHTFYNNQGEIDGLSQGSNPPEIIWRENIQTNNGDQESQNYPPSLFGNGFINPTQNLVDAFPMANGYPINHPNSGYSATNPYASRDPRLTHYVIYNGATAGTNNTVIQTTSQSPTVDALNNRETSTRTGYYLKKRLRMDVNRNPQSTSNKNKYSPRIRYTEMYLNYAEAANEAWGPTGSGTHAFSAYDVIKAIRKRAGIGTTNNDAYLEECKTDKDKMRQLIRNERRLELSFESFRFWDLRRWKEDLNTTAYGIDIVGGNYSQISVETRTYQDYMIYGPIPQSETIKYNNLYQNNGWE